MSIIRIQSFCLLVISYFVISQSKNLAKDGCVITFLDNFFLDVIHEKHKFKYLMNLTVKVYKSWCNDVYMSILQCENVRQEIF